MPTIQVVKVGPDRVMAAAELLVGPGAGPRGPASRRLVEAAGKFGIDLSLIWAVPDNHGKDFAQACLAVVGSGRTAMLFVSSAAQSIRPRSDDGSSADGRPDRPELALRQRTAVIREACTHLACMRRRPGPRDEPAVLLAQSLLEPDEAEAIEAFAAAGFQRLGDLAYLRRNIPRAVPVRHRQPPAWPPGVEVRRLAELPAEQHDALLIRALDRSYIDTLDCPELCGMRTVPDVLESHRSVGRFDPTLWWVALSGGQAEGCMLLTPCPEQHAVELVYMGLSPALRGRGLALPLLNMGLAELAGRREHTLTCAVDLRNTPALKLYRRAGFEHAAARVPMVLPLVECSGAPDHEG